MSSRSRLTEGQSSSVPAAQQPQDYYSVLANVIHDTETDSAQLRAMVYELARFNLKREALFGIHPMSIDELGYHMRELDHAIARVEAKSLGQKEKSGGQGTAITSHFQASVPPLVAKPFSKIFGQPAKRPAVIAPGDTLPPLYDGPIAFAPEINDRQRKLSQLRALLQFVGSVALGIALVGVIILGVGVIAGVRGQLHFGKPLALTADANRTLATSSNAAPNQATLLEAQPPVLPYPVPSTYGIYALSSNQLTELQALPMRVPDPRVLLSPEITKPATTTLADGRAAFIIFRRNLVNDAPEKLTLRVVAKIVREMKFVQGKPTITPLTDKWRIRATAYDLKVSPIPGHNEMVIANGPDNFVLAPGRYVLVLNGLGYDFSVAGEKESSAHCLELFESTSGEMYTECRKP